MTEDWARPLVHWEIQARDPAKVREFYSQLFNWTIGDGPVMGIPAGIGGPDPSGLSGHILASDTSRVVLYIQVRDLKESLAKAETLGGAITAQPLEIPRPEGGITIAGIADPEGNRVVLVQQ
jgi:predicted enzyme related to lactoylglutathione lyase